MAGAGISSRYRRNRAPRATALFCSTCSRWGAPARHSRRSTSRFLPARHQSRTLVPDRHRVRRVRAETPDRRHALRDGAPDGPGNRRAGRMDPTGGAASSRSTPPPEICDRTGRTLGEIPQRILAKGAHHIALPLRTLDLRPSLLRRPSERALLPHRSLDDTTGNSRGEDRNAKAL